MNVTFRCPHCDQTGRAEFGPDAVDLACPACQAKWPIPAGTGTNGRLGRCLICPSTELFIRKDFPQKLGLSLVIIAATAFLILAAWRAYFYLGASILVTAAMIDAILYVVVPRITVCYRCRAEFRGVPINPQHQGFELAIGEKYRDVKRET